MMYISVIVPTYKPGEYIWECLDSLERQTLSKAHFEVIIVLNGCNEPYYTQLKDYISRSQVQYNFIHIEEGGVSNARNIALDTAKGEYITFIDDDDFVSPSYLEELYENSSCDTMALCYPYAFNDGDMTQRPYRITAQYEKRVQYGVQAYWKNRKFFSGPCMKLIRKKYIKDRRFDCRFKNGEDCLFMFLISDEFKWTKFTSRDAIYYRRVRNNSANFRKRTLCDKIGNSIKLMLAYIKIYIFNLNKYNFCFFSTRVLGAIKTLLA